MIAVDEDISLSAYRTRTKKPTPEGAGFLFVLSNYLLKTIDPEIVSTKYSFVQSRETDSLDVKMLE